MIVIYFMATPACSAPSHFLSKVISSSILVSVL